MYNSNVLPFQAFVFFLRLIFFNVFVRLSLAVSAYIRWLNISPDYKPKIILGSYDGACKLEILHFLNNLRKGKP